MPRFCCPNCGQALSAPENCAGTLAKCPHCSARLVVPGLKNMAPARNGRGRTTSLTRRATRQSAGASEAASTPTRKRAFVRARTALVPKRGAPAVSFNRSPKPRRFTTDCLVEIEGRRVQVKFPSQYDAQTQRPCAWYTAFDVKVADISVSVTEKPRRMKLEEIFLPVYRVHLAGWLTSAFFYWLYNTLFTERFPYPAATAVALCVICCVLAFLTTVFACVPRLKPRYYVMKIGDHQRGEFVFAVPEEARNSVLAQFRQAGWSVRRSAEVSALRAGTIPRAAKSHADDVSLEAKAPPWVAMAQADNQGAQHVSRAGKK